MDDSSGFVWILLAGIALYLLLYTGLWKLLTVQRLVNRCERAEGEITEIHYARKNGAYRPQPGVTYTYNGMDYERTLLLAAPSARFLQGQRVTVLLDPEHPDRAYSENLSYERMSGWISVGSGVFCLVLIAIRMF